MVWVSPDLSNLIQTKIFLLHKLGWRLGAHSAAMLSAQLQHSAVLCAFNLWKLACKPSLSWPFYKLEGKDGPHLKVHSGTCFLLSHLPLTFAGPL